MKRYIVFIDGVCNLCNGLVKFINKFDKKNIFVFSSLQGETFKLLNEQLLLSKNIDYVILYSEQEQKAFTEGKAIEIILKNIKYFQVIGYFISIVPLFVTNFFYRIISKHRYKIFGKVEYCEFEKNINNKKILK
tara:strand:- start:494 stop:895 length:402 start_codon:yes stop_codon:yes gene_type:complete